MSDETGIGNRLRPRKRATTATTPGTTQYVTARVPVKRIGLHTAHHYCEHCGQKRRACTCTPAPMDQDDQS